MAGLIGALKDALPDYEVPEDDLIGDVLLPAMRCAEEVRIGVGFFSSGCLAQIAPGLADFIGRSDQPLRLLLSPALSDDDQYAIKSAVSSPEQVVQRFVQQILKGAELSASAVVQHTLECLAYLIAADRLQLRFVLMPGGMYHKKKWLFREGDNWLAVHGSGNATTSGLLCNGEQMTVDRAWVDGDAAARRVSRLAKQWDKQWNNEHPHSLTVSIAQGLRFSGSHLPESMPTVGDFWHAWKTDNAAGLEPALPPGVGLPPPRILAIPAGVEWRTGPYAHQGRAVDSLLAAGGRGVLEIATGGGKTRTALIAATLMQDAHDRPSLVVVLVPSTPLMNQWAEDIREFGVDPIVVSRFGPDERSARLEEVIAALSTRNRRTEVLIASNQLFAQDPSLRELLDRAGAGVLRMLIGDEMHNLGVQSFLTDPPEQFDKRVGLSATPIRQYDPDGTDQLFGFFGPSVFSFTLADAIAAGCLVPYRYVLHEVPLDDEEMDLYVDLTKRLRSAGFHTDDDGRTVMTTSAVEGMLRKRRAVLEQAKGKIGLLGHLLQEKGPSNVVRTLIYSSAKAVAMGGARQIEQVNGLLADLGIISHQFTNAETSRAESGRILTQFGRGDYQVLTAMKVLDEGIDIPQTDTAYVLASSSVRREWVQRRGRILRRAPGKERSTLHDFLVVPTEFGSPAAKSLLRSELARAEEFAGLAENEWAEDGPRAVISRYENAAWSGGGSN
ncbi:MAG: DEAD/DEAH box helicase family protein [Actinomycetota bacterium]